MRVRIVKRPSGTADGVALDRFLPGFVYDVGTSIANLLLAEGWAEPYETDRPAIVIPLPDERSRPVLLVVDDDPDTRSMLTTLLTIEGYAVHTAADGQEGVAMLRRHKPAMVLLDLKMPRMDGEAFRAAQRKLPQPFAGVPVVIISGSDGAESASARLNVAGVVRKPIDDKALLALIRSRVG